MIQFYPLLKQPNNDYYFYNHLNYKPKTSWPMIIAKQRKSLQSINSSTKPQRYQFINEGEESISCNFPLQVPNPIKFYPTAQQKQSNARSPNYKNKQNHFNSYSKKSTKKYDYSADLNNYFHPNKTNEKNHNKSTHTPQQSQNIPLTFKPSLNKSRRYSQTNQQKIDLKTYLKTYEPTLGHYANFRQKRPLNSSNNSNFYQPEKPFINQNFCVDNFKATDKFNQFIGIREKINSKDKDNEKSRYANIRNSKRCQSIKKFQNEQVKLQNSNFAPKQWIDFGKVLKQSQLQNKNITEKINRISKINEQINARLQKMLRKKFR